jgi:putative membrane protein
MISAAIANFASIVLADDSWHHDGAPWFIFAPLFWILVVFGIVWIVRAAPPWRRSRNFGPRRESGTEILERRFAEGDLDPDEYRQRRSTLDDREQR